MKRFTPRSGDIILYDNVFCGREYDHIGIVLKAINTELLTAEGNVDNRSQIAKRNRDEHIRTFIRFPEGYKY